MLSVVIVISDDGVEQYLVIFINSNVRDDQLLKKQLIAKEECLRQVHNSRVGHKRGRATWT